MRYVSTSLPPNVRMRPSYVSSCTPMRSALEPGNDLAHGDGHREVNRGDHEVRFDELATEREDAPLVRELLHPDVEEEGRRLQERDPLVRQGRHDDADRLGEDDRPHRTPVREPDGPRGVHPARGNALHPP